MKTEKKTDQLVTEAVQGSRGALEEIVRRIQKPVYSLSLRMLLNPEDAEDAAQETFLRAIRGMHRLRDPNAVGGWLRSTAHHVCVDVVRRQHSDAYEKQDVANVPARAQDDATQDELIVLIHSLPDTLREPVLLHYYENMTYDQIADWIGVARSTVNERLSKARHQLRRQLITQECHDEL